MSKPCRKGFKKTMKGMCTQCCRDSWPIDNSSKDFWPNEFWPNDFWPNDFWPNDLTKKLRTRRNGSY